MVDLFKKTVLAFDAWLDEENYQKIDDIISRDNVESNKISQCGMSEVPNHCHFVWLGCLNLNSLEYLKIWQEKASSLSLWIDTQSRYSILRDDVIRLIIEQRGCDIIEAQNIIFQFSAENEIFNLDDVLLSFAQEFFPQLIYKFQVENEKYQHNVSLLKQSIEIRDIREEFETLFFDTSFAKYYLYETLLRGNFAAASDIVRMLILNAHGGVYVDVDTLPKLHYDIASFQQTYQLNASMLNLVDVVLSHKLASQRLGNSQESDHQLAHCVELLNAQHPNIVSELQVIAQGMQFVTFQYPKVHHKLLSISASNNKLDEFNNNLIAAHPGSKAVRIVLREMKKRYRYCERHGYMLTANSGEVASQDIYYKRMQHYRYDGLNDALDEEVTLILTGPSLLLEVLIGCAYSLFNLASTTSPRAISLAFRLKQFGLSYSDQTMFTLKHINSSWMTQ